MATGVEGEFRVTIEGPGFSVFDSCKSIEGYGPNMGAAAAVAIALRGALGLLPVRASVDNIFFVLATATMLIGEDGDRDYESDSELDNSFACAASELARSLEPVEGGK